MLISWTLKNPVLTDQISILIIKPIKSLNFDYKTDQISILIIKPPHFFMANHLNPAMEKGLRGLSTATLAAAGLHPPRGCLGTRPAGTQRGGRKHHITDPEKSVRMGPEWGYDGDILRDIYIYILYIHYIYIYTLYIYIYYRRW